jgi:repressor LexA
MTSQYPKKRSHPRGDTQNRILEYIKKQVAEKGYPPSVREIGEAVGLKSTSTVHGHLKRLESKGLIKRDAMKPRAMELLIDNDASTNHMVQMVFTYHGAVTGLSFCL